MAANVGEGQQMKTLRVLALMAVCCATGTVTANAWAAEPPPARPAPSASTTPADESAAPQADETSATARSSGTAPGTQSEAEAAPPQAAAPKPKGSGKGGSPERFVPSEQVRADFDVSFPIDI
ncbi:MAG: hypothetical protein SXG53_03715 [Pseudomonadota bacterium]|nr:hypothetical protein [Pseudomonadota bacterium]